MSTATEAAELTPERLEALRNMEKHLARWDRMLGTGKPGAKQVRVELRSSLAKIRTTLSLPGSNAR